MADRRNATAGDAAATPSADCSLSQCSFDGLLQRFRMGVGTVPLFFVGLRAESGRCQPGPLVRTIFDHRRTSLLAFSSVFASTQVIQPDGHRWTKLDKYDKCTFKMSQCLGAL